MKELKFRGFSDEIIPFEKLFEKYKFQSNTSIVNEF